MRSEAQHRVLAATRSREARDMERVERAQESAQLAGIRPALPDPDDVRSQRAKREAARERESIEEARRTLTGADLYRHERARRELARQDTESDAERDALFAAARAQLDAQAYNAAGVKKDEDGRIGLSLPKKKPAAKNAARRIGPLRIISAREDE